MSFSKLRVLCPLLIASGGVIQPVSAQALVTTLWGSAPDSGFGFCPALGPDVSGDGVKDYVVSAPTDQAATGAVEIRSGIKLPSLVSQVLLRIVGPAPNSYFGWSFAVGSDLDGDGLGDLFIGVPECTAQGLSETGNGTVAAFSSRTGAQLWAFHAPGAAIAGQGHGFGFSVATPGDFNHDGFLDVIATAPFKSLAGAAYVLALSGLDGSVLATVQWPLPASLPQAEGLGLFAKSMGDMDGDGVGDVLISCGGGFNGGAILVSGNLLLTSPTIEGAVLTSIFWECLSPCPVINLYAWSNAGIAVADYNGDGWKDILIAEYSATLQFDPEETPKTFCGLVQIRSGRSGKLLGPAYQVLGDEEGEFYGTALAAGVTVLHNMAVSTLLVTAARATGPTGLFECGRAVVLAGNPPVPIYQLFGMGPGDEFGISGCELGDINGDGHTDFLIGAWQNGHGTPVGPGYVQVWLGGPGPWVRSGGGVAGISGVPTLSVAGAPQPAGSVTLDVEHAAPGAPATLVASVNCLGNTGFKGGLMVPCPQFLLFGLETDSTGRLTLPSAWPGGIPTGTLIALQAWILDDAATSNVSATNGAYVVTQ